MGLTRLWRNTSLGIRPSESDQSGPGTAFEERARRHAVRVGRKIAAAGLALVIGLWVVIVGEVRSENALAIVHARGQGNNLSAAFAEEVTRILDTVNSAMDLMARQIRADPRDFAARFNAHGINANRFNANGINAGGSKAEQSGAGGASIAPPIMSASWIGAQGTLLFTTLQPYLGPIEFGNHEAFKVHRDATVTGLFIGKPSNELPNQPISIPVSRRIEADDGTFLGVLIYHLAPGELTRLHRAVDLGKRGVLTLLCSDGVIRARFSANAPNGLLGIGTSVVGGPWRADMEAGSLYSYTRLGVVDQVNRLFTLRKLANYPLIVSVGLDMDDVLEGARGHRLLILIMGAAASGLMALLTILLVREMWRRTLREIDLARQHGRLEAAHAQILVDRGHLEVANRELLASTERAQAANRAKSQFLANMSHELRTPLHAIIGFSELIKEQVPKNQGGPPIADYANDILTSGRHLLDLINSILDLSKVESGTSLLVDIVVPIADVINASLIAIRGQARTRHIALEVVLPPDPPAVRVDLTKMRQILINLLSNAVKFTPEDGRITIQVKPSDDGGLVVSVIDTGIGMTEAEMAVALEPFGQVDNTLSRIAEGTGLGLPLAQRLIELHGGRLALHSVKRQGTTVEVVIPAERVVRMGAGG